MRSRHLTSGTGLILAACLFISVNIIVNTTLTNWRLDLTEDNLYTLSEGTLNILDNIEEPITLRLFFSREQLLGYPQLVNYGVRVRDMLREYVANSNGMLHLEIIDPKPFSDQEDTAVAEGLQSIPVGNAGEQAYFGLVGTNSTDGTEVIPFFAPNRERALEYELTKLVYKLANPERQVVGVISSLPVFGEGGRRSVAWPIIRVMREFFEVRDLDQDTDHISSDIEVLMVIHPKNLDDTTLYAIDQFALKGGKLMVFVDPFAEADPTGPDPNNPNAMPDRDSDLAKLFDAWGIEIPQDKIAADITAAIRVQHRGLRGAQEVPYLPWLRLTAANFNQESFITAQLRQVQLGTSSHIKNLAGSDLRIEPLLFTSTQSILLERDLIILQRDPNVILENYDQPSGRHFTLAARISGPVNTAFPRGKPLEKATQAVAEDEDFVSEGNVNTIVVADTDILSDRFWIREQDYYGMKMPQPIADNGDFVVNALDNLAGNTDLISLRSRGVFNRPFEIVERIRRAAEAEYREREQQLQAKLEEAQQRIQTMQQQGVSGLIISPEQAEEIEKLRREQIEIRKELRQVQHNLQKDIEALGSRLRFINIGLVPLLVAMLAVIVGVYQYYSRRRRD